MVRTGSLFSQLLGLFPRIEFQQAVREHKAERYAKGFTCWDQFVAMLFCQVAQAHSLREICDGLACCLGKLTHLGVSKAPNKSTLGACPSNTRLGIDKTGPNMVSMRHG